MKLSKYSSDSDPSTLQVAVLHKIMSEETSTLALLFPKFL